MIKSPDLFASQEIAKFRKQKTHPETIDPSKYNDNDYYMGAYVLGKVGSTKGILDVVPNYKEVPYQMIHIEGSNHVQVNLQGNHSNSIQTLAIQDLSLELLDEFKQLLKDPVDKNRFKWLGFLDKFNKIGGSVSLLFELFNMFTL